MRKAFLWHNVIMVQLNGRAASFIHGLEPVSLMIFARNSNSTKILPCCNSIDGHVETKLCTCHDSPAVESYTNFGMIVLLESK